jgi:hypothetical protein
MRNCLLALSVVLCAALVSGSANAISVDLTFSGVYVVLSGGGPQPFNYSMTYDTDLDTNTEFFASGSSVGGYIALNDFYGYSASGITSMPGGWATSEIVDRILSPPWAAPGGASAALWFDADIAVAAPTLMWMYLDDGPSNTELLELGGGYWWLPMIGQAEVELMPGAQFESGSALGYSESLTITSSVPEPTTALLLTLGLAGLGMRRRVH